MAEGKPSSMPAPSVEQLDKIAQKLGFAISPEDMAQYHQVAAGIMQSYSRLESLTEPSLPAKYPNRTSYRPPAEENEYNAWYYKSDIKGADSGRLSGKTLAIKDSIPVAQVPMMNGSKLLEGYVPEFDATVVTRILEAGGHIKGKSVCTDMCIGGSSVNSANEPVLNPVDKTRDPSGSSSGNAALLAAGEVDMAVGGDQGGSIRLPAAWCGVVGMKPTWGLVPYTGACSLDPPVDHLGPMARTVDDCALLLQVIAGSDGGLDPRQPKDLKVPDYLKQLNLGVKGLKIGLLEEGFASCELDVAELVKSGAKKLESAGAQVEDVSVAVHADGEVIYQTGALTGIYNTVMRNATSPVCQKSFFPSSMIDHIARAIPSKANDLGAPDKLVMLVGAYIDEHCSNRHAMYAKSQNLARDLAAGYDQALAKYDVLVLPTVRFKAPPLQPADTPVGALVFNSVNMFSNTSPFNVTGHPALSISAGRSDGLPVGMMIVGKQFDDAMVLRVARAFEQLRDA